MHSVDAKLLELWGKPPLTSWVLLLSNRTRKPGKRAGPIDSDTPTKQPPQPPIAKDAIRGQESSSLESILVIDELQAPMMPDLDEPNDRISPNKVRISPRFESLPSPIGCAESHFCWDDPKPNLQDSITSTASSSTRSYPVFIRRRPQDDPVMCCIEAAPTSTLGSFSNNNGLTPCRDVVPVWELDWVGEEDESERAGDQIVASSKGRTTDNGNARNLR